MRITPTYVLVRSETNLEITLKYVLVRSMTNLEKSLAYVLVRSMTNLMTNLTCSSEIYDKPGDKPDICSG